MAYLAVQHVRAYVFNSWCNKCSQSGNRLQQDACSHLEKPQPYNGEWLQTSAVSREQLVHASICRYLLLRMLIQQIVTVTQVSPVDRMS